MFEQINKALLWLKNNNKIDDYQYNVLQDYYRKNYNIDVDVLRDELFKLGTDPSFVLSKISEIEESNIDVIEFDDYNVLNNDYKNDNVSNFSNDKPLNTSNQFSNDNSFNISMNTVNQSNSDNENFVQKELFILKGEYPDSIISLTDIPHHYILSKNGKDEYVNVEGSNGIYRMVKVTPNDVNTQTDGLSSNNLSVQSYHNSNSKKKTLSTLAGRLMSDDGFTNSLFFIFLAGLSTGVVFMIILNFFMK